MKTKNHYLPCLAVAFILLAGPARAESTARGILVERVRNDHPAFNVRVSVDHPDRIYREGDQMRVSVSSNRGGYLYLLYLDASGKVSCLFPNDVDANNAIPAGKDVIVVPGPDAAFRLRIGSPFGRETLKAIVTLQPLPKERLKGILASGLEGAKGAYVELKEMPNQWAEHSVDVTTVKSLDDKPPAGGQASQNNGQNSPNTQNSGQNSQAGGQAPHTSNYPSQPGGQPPPIAGRPGPKRVGLFVGLSRFADPRVPSLTVSDKDAQTMAKAMEQFGRLDKIGVLVNEQATLKNIQQAICTDLPAMTRPGDTVFIYWSGHGGRCANENGTEKDGFDEYLVPYDGRLENIDTIRKTMLIDDMFGRWMQDLDGRRIVVILDTCYSAGQSERSKGLGGARFPTKGGGFTNFLEDALERVKDIGQKETAVLASSKPNQVSFERKEGDLSAMTYFLVEQLRGGSQRMTLPQAFNSIKGQITQYVETNFPGGTQVPVLIDNTTPPLYFKP